MNIHPTVNLVQNIGVGGDATHTTKTPGQGAPPAARMQFPLSHPPFAVADRRADRNTYCGMLGPVASAKARVKSVIRRVAPGLLKLR
jgi:hypothetical protein